MNVILPEFGTVVRQRARVDFGTLVASVLGLGAGVACSYLIVVCAFAWW